ncbi:MAG TPA: hypothetical protein VFS39_07540 [Nitrospira sp.]|nr:hypothetical protein [Nitrospira sp.]
MVVGMPTGRFTVLACMLSIFLTQTACGSAPTITRPLSGERHLDLGTVSPDIRRLAVWYPRTAEREVAYGYSRLEQAAFQLKKQRAGITIVERRNMGLLRDEQRLQASGPVDDGSAVHVGRWLGADSLVVFRIEMPNWRDRMLARFHATMPPFVVSSKIISVESGEVLYHDVVTAEAVAPKGGWTEYASDYELQPLMRSALDHALTTAIARLQRSFRQAQ